MQIFTDEAIAKLAEHKDDFLRAVPNNEMIEDDSFVSDNPEDPIPSVKKYTDLEHFNNWVISEIKKKIARGKQLNYYDNYTPVDEDWTA